MYQRVHAFKISECKNHVHNLLKYKYDAYKFQRFLTFVFLTQFMFDKNVHTYSICIHNRFHDLTDIVKFSSKNNCSQQLEKTSSEIEKLKAEVAFSARDFPFSDIGQLSKLSIARCWQSRLKKMENLSRKKHQLRAFIPKMKFFFRCEDTFFLPLIRYDPNQKSKTTAIENFHDLEVQLVVKIMF